MAIINHMDNFILSFFKDTITCAPSFGLPSLPGFSNWLRVLTNRGMGMVGREDLIWYLLIGGN